MLAILYSNFFSPDTKDKFCGIINEMKELKCKTCKCTDKHACKGGCYWINESVCSACWLKNGNMTKLIKRTYRITTEQDKKVKTSAKKNKESESSFIRKSIEIHANSI
jgi:hypothetical protein